MGRPRTNFETVSARFGLGTLERIRKCLLPGETRSDFIRDAVGKEIDHREAALGMADRIAGGLGRAVGKSSHGRKR